MQYFEKVSLVVLIVALFGKVKNLLFYKFDKKPKIKSHALQLLLFFQLYNLTGI